MDISNDAILENDQKNFLINYISLRKAARNEFYASRLKEKTCSCWKPLLKLRKAPQKKSEKKEYELGKETIRFLHHIDYVRMQDFDLNTLMGCEITSTCFFLTKKRFDPKAN